MRKRAVLTGIVIIAGAVVSGLVSAQEAGVTVGLKGGAINTCVHADMAWFLNTNWRSGLTGGGFASFDLSSLFVIEDCHDPILGLDTHRRDSGLVFGGALDLRLHSVLVIFDARYAHGLRNLFAVPGAVDRLESRALSFTVGFGWRL